MKKNTEGYIFFDLDGMKFNSLPMQVAYINQRYEIEVLPHDYRRIGHHLDLIVKEHRPGIIMSREEIYADFGNNFLASKDWHKNVMPMQDMPEVMKELAKKYTLMTVTARQTHGRPVIEYLLDKFIPGCISHIHCVWNPRSDGGFDGIKKKVFIESILGEKIGFLDDSPFEIEDTKHSIPSFLFDPDHIHSKIEGATHVHSWKEIGDLFL